MILQDDTQKSAEALALQSYIDAAWATLLPTLTLGPDSASRLGALEKPNHTWQIIIFSDGLDLHGKIALERAFLSELVAQQKQAGNVPVEVTAYFRKRIPEVSGGPKLPKESGSRPSPFGLKVNKRAIPGVRHVIAVASGKGGVGKSTVSTNLAVALASSGQRVGLLDADIYGPSAPTMLGAKASMAVASGGRLEPVLAHGVKVVSFGFLSDAYNPVIWRGPMVSKALEQLFYSVDWGELDYLVVDLPPGTGDVQLTLAERLPIHGAIVVTTPQDVALIDAHKAVTMFEKLDVPILGLVENMACFTCPSCGHEEDIFGDEGFAEFSRERRLPVLARIPLNRKIRMGADAGIPAAVDAESDLAKPYFLVSAAVISKS